MQVQPSPMYVLLGESVFVSVGGSPTEGVLESCQLLSLAEPLVDLRLCAADFHLCTTTTMPSMNNDHNVFHERLRSACNQSFFLASFHKSRFVQLQQGFI